MPYPRKEKTAAAAASSSSPAALFLITKETILQNSVGFILKNKLRHPKKEVDWTTMSTAVFVNEKNALLQKGICPKCNTCKKGVGTGKEDRRICQGCESKVRERFGLK